MSWAMIAVHRACGTRLHVEPTTPDEADDLALMGHCTTCGQDVPESLWGWEEFTS